MDTAAWYRDPGPVNTTYTDRHRSIALTDSTRIPAGMACPDCEGTHWVETPDGRPLRKCTHPRLVRRIPSQRRPITPRGRRRWP